jgi:hypothetical protein
MFRRGHDSHIGCGAGSGLLMILIPAVVPHWEGSGEHMILILALYATSGGFRRAHNYHISCGDTLNSDIYNYTLHYRHLQVNP